MDRIKEALSKFRKPYNCAQTVYVAVKPEDAEGIAGLANCGGGKAPDGICGALYAAIKLKPQDMAAIKANFKETTGSEYCCEIKTVHKTPCERCVECALTNTFGE